MQIDDRGGLFLVARLGDATPQTMAAPRWPAQRMQQLDEGTLAGLRRSAAAFAAGPAYRGHEGVAGTSVFVVTIALDDGEKTLVVEAHQDEFVAHLCRITEFVHTSQLTSPQRRQ